MTDPSLRDVAEAYKRLAPKYDEMTVQAPFLVNSYLLYEKLMNRFLRGRRFQRILDLGCGSGLQTVELARHGEEVVGLDISPDLITQARERCKGLANVRFVVDDARHLSFPDKTFDCILSYGDVLSHMTDGYEQAISEMARVSRAGGVVSFEVDNKWNAGLLYKPRELCDAVRAWGRGHDTRVWEGMRFKTFLPREITGLLATSGFETLSLHSHNILASLIPDRYVLEEGQRSIGGRIALLLGKADLALSGLFPFSHAGFNLIVTAQKK